MRHLPRFENFDYNNQNSLLDDISSRIKTKEFRAWMEDNNWIVGEDEESCIEDFLYDTYTISIDEDNRVIEFETLDNQTKKIIGDNYVKLYHFAPSKFKEDISTNGLRTGISKTNPYKNSYSGIYLTTQITGNTIDGYKMNIRNSHDCEPILVTVKMKLSEIQKDLDDKDIRSGNYQFVSGDISPERILDIEDVW